ncbi:MAG: phosphoenolpyruvate--protein phosphotransferase [Eubacteriales bacterium]|nr:phosphoenolpyruvate--protein phosphotransferase [Eubacteriales bacterium]
MITIQALGVSEGLVKANAFVLRQPALDVSKRAVTDVAAEQARVDDAIERAKQQIEQLMAAAGGEQAEILDAHLMMLDDPDFSDGMKDIIAAESVCAEYACKVNCENFQQMFRAMDDEYMQARAADIGDISDRVQRVLQKVDDDPLDGIDAPCIVVASDLTPSDTAKIGSKPVWGFITQIGGRTSHSAIMARSMGLPAAAGAGERARLIENGDAILLDGCSGAIVVNPDAATEEAFDRKKAQFDEQRRMLEQYRAQPGATADGHRVVIEGNIGTPADAMRVDEVGGEGIGLFRSEFLFMDRADLPGEQEQFEAYRQVAQTMTGRPVIIRTLDIGGDKEVPALALEKEQNPFLGYRAIRICLDREELFLTQLRALLRASAFGDIRIMFPMISSLEEVRSAKAMVEKAKEQLKNEGVAFNEAIKLGIMIEIPVAAICADILAKEVDFFSIGTNDLIQYSCAVDRINDKLAALYRPLHPGVLRLIKMAADAARENGIDCGVCGEMAGSRGMASVLCGLGVTHLSMSASSILAAKNDLAHHSYEDCVRLASSLLGGVSATENESQLV